MRALRIKKWRGLRTLAWDERVGGWDSKCLAGGLLAIGFGEWGTFVALLPNEHGLALVVKGTKLA